jgi:CRISPR/Cas system-associated protein Csx1
MKKHKLLTYGSPCYIEVIAPGYYPLLYKCPGAFNRETKVLAKKYTEASVKPIKGTTTADKPAISNFQLYVLEKVSDDIITRDGIDYREFKIDKKDMKAKPASGFYMFAEDGCYQVNEKLVNNQPLVGGKYADIAISYSIAKEKTGTDTQATLKMEEGGSAVTLATKATDIIDGRDYKPLTRS